MKPPRRNTSSRLRAPPVFAMIIVLQTAAAEENQPASFWGKSNGVVTYDHPNNGFKHRNWDLQEKSWESESPRRVEEEIPLLIKDRQPLNNHRKFRKAIEHVNDHAKQQCSNVHTSIVFSLGMHFGPQEHGGGDDSDDDDLNSLENVHKRVPLDQQPLLVEICFHELFNGDCVFVEHQCCSVTS
nr:hypothetical protein BHM03_00028372 [Ipomoea batatas]